MGITKKRTTSNSPSGVPEAGAATPVYAENAVCAVCAPCGNHSLSAISAVSAVSAPCGNADSLQEFEQLVEAIEAAGVDITSDYNDWYKIAIAIANTFGEQGRSMFHRISKLYIDYNSNEADKKYNQCLRDPNPQIRINTIYYYAKQAGVKLPHTSQYAPFPHGAETAETADFTHHLRTVRKLRKLRKLRKRQWRNDSPIKAVFSLKRR